MRTILELVRHFVARGRWFVVPLLAVLLAAAVLLLVSQGLAVVAPFVYTLF